VFRDLNNFLQILHAYTAWRIGLELLIIGTVVYWLLRVLRGTRGVRLLKGLALLLVLLTVIVRLIASALDLKAVDLLYQEFLSFAELAIVVVFQPELRRALMRLGETRLFRSFATGVEEQVDELVEAAMFCAKRKIGALIAVEREVGLGGIAENGILLNAELSANLLNTIFWPNSPLHDLGVIVSGGRIMYAGVQFPLAEPGDLEKKLGSRHRAAVGMSQESDAVVIVVSEETGDVSVAESGKLLRKLTPDALRDLLIELLGGTRPGESAGTSAIAVPVAQAPGSATGDSESVTGAGSGHGEPARDATSDAA
jgi:diadenylate cyclase